MYAEDTLLIDFQVYKRIIQLTIALPVDKAHKYHEYVYSNKLQDTRNALLVVVTCMCMISSVPAAIVWHDIMNANHTFT